MQEFAKSVQLKRGIEENIALTGEKSFTWDDRYGSMEVLTFQQKTALRYRLVKDLDWIVEIARYDTYDLFSRNSKPVETTWAASMWNSEWDSVLVANANLEIGQSADSNPNMNTFFPRNGGSGQDGVKKFLGVVGEVTKFLDDLRKELPHLRRN